MRKKQLLLKDAGFSTRSYNILRRSRVLRDCFDFREKLTVEKMANLLSREEIMKLKNCGRKTEIEIVGMFYMLGYAIKGYSEEELKSFVEFYKWPKRKKSIIKVGKLVKAVRFLKENNFIYFWHSGNHYEYTLNNKTCSLDKETYELLKEVLDTDWRLK